MFLYNQPLAVKRTLQGAFVALRLDTKEQHLNLAGGHYLAGDAAPALNRSPCCRANRHGTSHGSIRHLAAQVWKNRTGPRGRAGGGKSNERIPYLTLGKVSVPYLALENFFFPIWHSNFIFCPI
jgi:hypothetical protein